MGDLWSYDPADWDVSAIQWQTRADDYSAKLNKINKQIEYANAVKEDIDDLVNDNTAVENDLDTLGTALSNALDDSEAGNAVVNLNSDSESYDISHYISSASTECQTLIDDLTTERDTLQDDYDDAVANAASSASIAEQLRNEGY